ncbi:hypothetical protein EYF80_026710 [Liparis tanakae]|uniref:Uncharacterized protein n=1 Tax=Liparis tanakae TaxID=230148 RepID=A0A4Z2HDW8_9TELE|nr:hypothetical protein EYF80_026710 [Liparis tanakae]
MWRSTKSRNTKTLHYGSTWTLCTYLNSSLLFTFLSLSLLSFVRLQQLFGALCLDLLFSCSRAERSLSSCCRSSSISLLTSSTFSSSSVSGEPMPSSFSSARLLLGDEPLNSWRDTEDKT